jgi:hypothetical protein
MTRSAVHNRVAILAAVLGAACSGGSGDTATIMTRDSAGITIVENDIERMLATCRIDTIPAVSIGSVDGDENYELYRVFGASRLEDGRIVLVNQGSQQLRYYDAEGRFLMSAGRAGEGPGEFRDAFYLWVLPGDTIWVGDYRPWQFQVFSPEGEWVRTVRPTPEYPNPPGQLNVLDDGRSILAERPFTAMRREFELREITVVIHGPDGQLRDTIGAWPDGRWGRVSDDPGALGMSALFDSYARMSAAGSRFIAGHSSAPSLSVFEADDSLRLDHIIRWTAGARDISADDVAAERQRIRDQYAETDPAMQQRLVEPLVSDERPVAGRFPAFASLQIGRDGRAWVREYTRPRGPRGQRWMGFDARGRFLCTATMPDVDQVYEFGADYVLSLDRDANDVERVVLHNLRGPSSE